MSCELNSLNLVAFASGLCTAHEQRGRMSAVWSASAYPCVKLNLLLSSNLIGPMATEQNKVITFIRPCLPKVLNLLGLWEFCSDNKTVCSGLHKIYLEI